MQSHGDPWAEEIAVTAGTEEEVAGRGEERWSLAVQVSGRAELVQGEGHCSKVVGAAAW